MPGNENKWLSKRTSDKFGTCSWREAKGLCVSEGTKVIPDSGLRYCEFHYDRVMWLRDWLVGFMRDKRTLLTKTGFEIVISEDTKNGEQS